MGQLSQNSSLEIDASLSEFLDDYLTNSHILSIINDFDFEEFFEENINTEEEEENQQSNVGIGLILLIVLALLGPGVANSIENVSDFIAIVSTIGQIILTVNVQTAILDSSTQLMLEQQNLDELDYDNSFLINFEISLADEQNTVINTTKITSLLVDYQIVNTITDTSNTLVLNRINNIEKVLSELETLLEALL